LRHEKAGQVLELARHLAASAEGLTLDEMAIATGAGRRTAERLRDALETLFPQMEVLQDGSIKRFRIPKGLDGFFQAPDLEELVELARAAATLRRNGHLSRAGRLESLDRKVRAAMKSSVLRRVATDIEVIARAETTSARTGPRPFEDSQMLATLREAIMGMCAVRFRYSGGSNPGSWRTVCPYGIVFERMNYLVAAELNADAPRTWRLDRIQDLALTDTPACAPETFSLDHYASQSFGVYQDQIENVVLRITPEGAQDARGWRFHGTQILEEQPDGSVIVKFTSGGMRELAWHLVTWDERVEIMAPERLKTTMRDLLEVCCRRHFVTTTTVSVAGVV
jgi:predicted DNA-binding transcriptional regulator YafY